MSPVKWKKCRICKEPLPLHDFYPHKGYADNHMTLCKKCNAIVGREYRTNNKEKVKTYSRKYYKENPKQVFRRRINTAKNLLERNGYIVFKNK